MLVTPIELRLALISYQGYHTLLLTLAGRPASAAASCSTRGRTAAASAARMGARRGDHDNDNNAPWGS